MACTDIAVLCYDRPHQQLCPFRISHRHDTLSMSSTRRWGPPMMIESLESRQLLAVTAVYNDQGILIVTGTRRADHIEVGPNADIAPGDTTVMANGRLLREDQTIPLGVIIDGGGGNDDLSIGQSMGFYIAPVTIRGGDGDDVIHEGSYASSRVVIYGGLGDDQISSNDLYGGPLLV